MILLELDPNVVKPGWTPLLILVGLALVMVLLFRSMRRQFRRADASFGVVEQAPPAGSVPVAAAADVEPVPASAPAEDGATPAPPPPRG